MRSGREEVNAVNGYMGEERIIARAKKAVFFAVAVMMYFFINEILNVGVFVTYRHVFALALTAFAILCFLLRPNVARLAVALKDALAYSVPLFVTLTASLYIWFAGHADTSVIARGLSGSIAYNNMLSFALAAAAFLYMFGERGIWYNLAAMLAANLLMIAKIVVEFGLGSYLSELIRLVVTFAGDTGEIIVRAEVHELAFCLGAYIIFMLMKPQKNKTYLVLLALTLFCFVSAFKRIGIIAVAAALVIGFLVKFTAKYSEKTAVGLAVFFTLTTAALLFAYIAVIKLGAFEYLEKSGVDTTGRAEIYSAVSGFYEFSPDFLGHGIGFLTYRLSSGMNVGVSSVHNDFLQYYIDLGVWGYIAWLLSMTAFRLRYFGKNGIDRTVTVLSLTLYLVIVSMTDNTMNYPLLTATLAVLMSGNGFDERAAKADEKIFGRISDENKPVTGGRML